MGNRRILASLLLAACAALAGCAPDAGSGASTDAAALDGEAPAAAAAAVDAADAGAGQLLVGNKSAASVWRLSMADGSRLGEAATGEGPHEIAVSPDGRIAVVADYGSGAVEGHTLTVLDLGGGPARSIDLGANTRPHGLRFLPGGRRLAATTEGSDALVVVDAEGGVVERAIGIGPGKGHMVALSGDGGVAYVSKVGSGGLVRVDLAAAMAAEDEAARAAAVREAPAGAGAAGRPTASQPRYTSPPSAIRRAARRPNRALRPRWSSRVRRIKRLLLVQH